MFGSCLEIADITRQV